jgi:hypothetical protein
MSRKPGMRAKLLGRIRNCGNRFLGYERAERSTDGSDRRRVNAWRIGEIEMCCCGKPTINGELGYRWNNPNAEPMIHPVNAPDVSEGETILYDEPGRCGGIDSHSFHYRVTKLHGSLFLLVRHGAGDERIRLSLYGKQAEVLAGLDSNGRYWLLNAIFHAQSEARHEGEDKQATRYRQAFIDGRLRKRKERNGTAYKVWIEPKIIPREPVPPDSTIPAGTEILLNSGQ